MFEIGKMAFPDKSVAKISSVRRDAIFGSLANFSQTCLELFELVDVDCPNELKEKSDKIERRATKILSFPKGGFKGFIERSFLPPGIDFVPCHFLKEQPPCQQKPL